MWPSLRDLFDARGPILIPTVVLIVARVVLWTFVPFASEDAYITFRFARHLADGSGLVYNPGERVFGFSSALWTLWMALGIGLTRAPVLWARVSTLAAELMLLWLMVQLLRRHASNASAWCFAYFFAVWPYFSAVSVSGLENTVMLALCVLAAALVERGSRWAGIAVAAVALIRPEGLAAAAVLSLWARGRDRWIAAGLVSIALGGLSLYFGTPVPQSVLAKSQLYGTPGPWAGRYWWDWLSPFIVGHAPTLIEGVHLFVLSVVFAPSVVVGASALWPARRSGLACAIAGCLVVWLGYTLLGVAYFWWYLLVPLGGFAALAAVGFPRIVRGPGIYVSAAMMVLGMWTLAPHLYIGRAQAEYFGFARVAQYLRLHARPGEKAMLEPIGMIGYQVPIAIVDETGLVSPEVARRRLKGPGWYADVVAHERPDWLVVRRGLLRGGGGFAGAGAPFRDLAERDSVLVRYAVETVTDSSAGDAAMVVLRRRR